MPTISLDRLEKVAGKLKKSIKFATPKRMWRNWQTH